MDCSSEKAMAPHSSTLAWKTPWTEEPSRLRSMGSLRVGHDSATSLSLFTFMHWRRKWQPTPVFLSGESQGRGVPGGLPSMESYGVGHDWINLAAAGLSLPGFPVHHQCLELPQTHVHWVSDAIQPSHPLSSPFPPALSLSQHHSLSQLVSCLRQVAKVVLLKNPPANVGDGGLIPGSGRSLEEEMATHSSVLAWRIPWI